MDNKHEIKYLIFKNTIVLNNGVKNLTINRDDKERFDKVIDSIKNNCLTSELFDIIDNEARIEIEQLLKIKKRKKL